VKPRILVVDDEPAIRVALKGLLDKQGYDVDVAAGGDEAIESLGREPYDLVLVDLALGRGKTGLDVLAASRTTRPGMPVILVTAHGSEKVAVQAMKAGAHDYVPKPFDNDEMRIVVERALERTRLEREHRLLLDRVAREHGLGAMIGASTAMRSVFETIHKVAGTDLTVLVHGESGTGKELVAQALHEGSSRRTRPFVAVNCAAMSRDLVESELFGHEKGAFTGAGARRAGRFESADGGTLLLDEVGDMPRETQAKVLRVLQERSFERVGGTTTLKVDVRVVAATHRDLEAEVRTGAFREDLYYRLRVVEVTLPPLRDRPEDIPALVARFLLQVAERLGRPKASISAPALAALATHRWPGNVRELRNVVERAAVLASGTAIDTADLALDAGKATAQAVTFAEAKRRVIEDFERSYLRAALGRHGGNVSRTAEAIGMVRQSLQQKMRELGLAHGRGGSADDPDGK
jgi:DNA-binding NtrC family response regulator